MGYVTDVQTAVPPPNGILLTGHRVEISYSEGWSIWMFNQDQDTRMVLSTRGSDCNYVVLVELRAQDASGRHFYDGGYVQVVENIARVGNNYGQCLTRCETATLVMLSKVRTKPQLFVNTGRRAGRPDCEGSLRGHCSRPPEQLPVKGRENAQGALE